MRTLLTAAVVAFGLTAMTVPAQALSWQPCGDGGQCATLSVPANRTKPGGRQIDLALARHQATGPDRIGSLVFNPGGPGGSGTDSIDFVWELLPEPVKARFDLVTWDPRGINKSRPNLDDCRGAPLRLPATGPVAWEQVARGFMQDIRAANRACQRSRPAVVRRTSTNANVADLDRIRAALGDRKLSYWGMSYGTRIGYVYALTHPKRVRALVLDGSIDPASTILSLAEGAPGPDQAFGPFADAYPVARRQFNALQKRLARATVRLPDGQTFDRWVLRDMVFNNVAQQAAYPYIAQFLQLAHDAVVDGKRKARGQLAATTKRVIEQRIRSGNAGGAFAVTNCNDYPDRPSLGQAMPIIEQQVALGPNFGGVLAIQYALGCTGLKLDPDPVPTITGRGSNVPVLVLGASRDGSTVNSWTARMSRAFPRSRTVTYAGGQHVTWAFAGSACVDDVANTYMLTGQLPLADVGCSNSAG